VKIVKAFRYQLITIIMGVIFVDVFFLEKNSDIFVFPVVIFWYLLMKIFKFQTKHLTMILSSFLLISLIGNIFGKMIWTEKAVSWFFVLFLVTVIYDLVGLRKGND